MNNLDDSRIILQEAKERWAELVFETSLKDLREEASVEITLNEQRTVADILSVFDEKASGLDDKFNAIVGDIVNLIVDFAQKVNPEIFQDTDVDSPEDASQDLVEKLQDMGKNFKGLSRYYARNKDEMGPRKAAAEAFKSDEGRAAIEDAKELKDNEVIQAAAQAAGGELLKKLIGKIAEFVPFGKQIMDAIQLVTSVSKVGGKLKRLMNKFKKSKATPQEKFADFAEKIARGPDQELGEFASILQMEDDIEEVLDDRLEIKYVRDYVAQLRKVDPETPVNRININDVITKWIKDDEGLKQASLKVT
tara:strand:+ start:2517 stop:3437 length:921 start_codon:yes stop_codon:yes gene_type:complete